MGAPTIMSRIKTRFSKNLEAQEMQDWDVPTEIYTPRQDLETLKTELVTKSIVNQCPKCGIQSNLKDGSCIKCDRGLI